MRIKVRSTKFLVLSFTILIFLVSSPVSAEDKSPDDWQYWFELYGWLPQIRMKTSEGDEINLKLKDLLKNLDMIFMGEIGGRKGDWSLSLDTIYMNLGASETMTANIIGRPQELDVEVDMRSVISTLNAGHTVYESPRNRLDVIGGARYLYLKNILDFDVQATPGAKRAILGGHHYDFLLGLKGRTFINDQWHFDYYGDVGSGDSKVTWQGKVGFGYEFNKWTGTFGFRYMRYKFEPNEGLNTMEVIGPYLGARWAW